MEIAMSGVLGSNPTINQQNVYKNFVKTSFKF
jgi:hypothetical protein